jgi:pre-rRNA-processing protein RIX1
MAPVTSELAILRALTFRISSTATSQLPQHVPAIAASLANCRTLLSSPQSAVSKSSSEITVALHKYRTLLSTLLQDRTIQGRWAAIVLIKATIEIGEWETLQKSLPWVRGLLSILNKPEPPSSKKLCIITLTRIFIRTREYPTLVREITTPSLPAFVQSGLQIATSKAPASLLQTILQSFNELLPRHPTIFRSYLKQLNPLLASLVAPTPSSKLGEEQKSGQRFELTTGVTTAAQQLYVQTSCCAPKGASSDEWEKSLKAAINNAHRVADKVFRAVIEDWRSSTRNAATNGHTLDDELQDLEPDSMSLPGWAGMFAGSERLVHLLHLIEQYLASLTANSVGLNISSIMDLITRILSITTPGSGGKIHRDATAFNNQISKEERDSLWQVLPALHVAATGVLLALTKRSQSSTLPLDSLIVDQLVWVFASERDFAQIRSACYHGIAMVLRRSGVGLAKVSIDSLVPLMRACCEDLVPTEGPVTAKPTPGQSKANGNTPSQTTGNADTFLNSSKGIDATGIEFVGLTEAAHDLLPLLFANIRAQYLSDAMRGRLDRTAILTQNKSAMLASVLNPPPSKRFGKPVASILPLMARSFPGSADVERTKTRKRKAFKHWTIRQRLVAMMMTLWVTSWTRFSNQQAKRTSHRGILRW